MRMASRRRTSSVADPSVTSRIGQQPRGWEIAGIVEDRGPLIDGVAVSESPELYLAGPSTGTRAKRRSTQRKRRA